MRLECVYVKLYFLKDKIAMLRTFRLLMQIIMENLSFCLVFKSMNSYHNGESLLRITICVRRPLK